MLVSYALIYSTLGIPVIPMSAVSEEGIMNAKTEACDRLLAQRVDVKVKSKKVNDVLNRLHVAIPKPRDNVERLPYIPDGVKEKSKFFSLCIRCVHVCHPACLSHCVYLGVCLYLCQCVHLFQLLADLVLDNSLCTT